LRPVPLIRAGVFAPFVKVAAEIDPRLVGGLARVHITPDMLEDGEALIPLEQALLFVEFCARQTGAADFGLQVGRHRRIADLGIFGLLVRQSLTLHEALATACAMLPGLNSGAVLTIEGSGDEVWLRHRFVLEGRPGNGQALLYTLPLLIDLVRTAAGRDWLPRKVLLPDMALRSVSDPAWRHRLHRADGDEVAISIDAALLSLPLHQPNSRTETNGHSTNGNGNGNGRPGEIDHAALRQRFADGSPLQDPLASLEQVLQPRLRGNHANLETLAEICRVSARTLQRVLEREGLTFSRLMDRTRFHRAHRLLTGGDMKLIEIACELGYLELANFSRAFRRWTGISPSVYRARYRQTNHQL
jgi:AraC-like DNA-binding protein